MTIQHTPDHIACPVCDRINAGIRATNHIDIVRLVNEELRHGDRRSYEYTLGVIDLICRRKLGTPMQQRYEMGSVQADAYYAGVDRGWAIWKKLGGEEGGAR